MDDRVDICRDYTATGLRRSEEQFVLPVRPSEFLIAGTFSVVTIFFGDNLLKDEANPEK